MRTKIAALMVLFALSLLAQSYQEEVTVINVEVPVRVYKDGKFVEGLTKDDFIVYEDGVPQKILAVYLIKKKSIKYREEEVIIRPQVHRTFFLIFRLHTYTTMLNQGLDYFVRKVIAPGDVLYILTPWRTYHLKKEALVRMPRAKLASQLKALVRRDLMLANSRYRHLIEEARGIVAGLKGSLEAQSQTERTFYDTTGNIEYLLGRYEQILEELEKIAGLNEKVFVNFAKLLKSIPGNKYAFIFYQREFLPQISPQTLTTYMSLFQDKPGIYMKIQQLFTFYYKPIWKKEKLIEKYFADSGASLHFIYMKTEREPDEYAEDISNEFYNAFTAIAEATGGGVYTTYNPSQGFEKALQESEHYYLIYYRPSNTKLDGSFRKITVKVKGKGYKVLHKKGYFARPLK